VERLAYRIASFPAEAIALAKASVDAAELPTTAGLLEEAHYFNRSLATAGARQRMESAPRRPAASGTARLADYWPTARI
jgi:hypothetical protein